MKTKTVYEDKALMFAEKYGIVNYSITGNTMTYYETFKEAYREYWTYRCDVNLDTMKENRRVIKKEKE